MTQSAGSNHDFHYQGLAIYKAAVALFVCLDKTVKAFSNHHRYVLGNELRLQSLRVPVLIMRANHRDQRVAALNELCLAAESLKIMVNLGKEIEAYASFTAYADLARQVVDLARQAEAWRRHSVQSRAVAPQPAIQRGPE
ncbi:MAG: four helix bundle protein [Deltaproteobacteria bacterium]|nr:four helix bundle protein [Deltaproteobacteria bacterium]